MRSGTICCDATALKIGANRECLLCAKSTKRDQRWNVKQKNYFKWLGTTVLGHFTRPRTSENSISRERERGAKIGFDLILERWQRDELSQKYKCIQIESNRRQYADLFYLFSCAFARCSRQPSKVFWYFIIMTNLVLLIKKIPQLSLHITQQHAAMRVHWNLQWKNRYRNQNGVSWELNCYNFSVSVWCALCGN